MTTAAKTNAEKAKEAQDAKAKDAKDKAETTEGGTFVQKNDVDQDKAVADAQKDAEKAKEAAAKDAEKADKEQAEAAAKAAEAKGQPKPEEKRALADERDGVDLVNKGWTVQDARPYLDYQPEVGQAFTKGQLPDRQVQKDAGIDPDAWAAGVVVLDDDGAVAHPAGPEPDEARNLGLVK